VLPVPWGARRSASGTPLSYSAGQLRGDRAPGRRRGLVLGGRRRAVVGAESSELEPLSGVVSGTTTSGLAESAPAAGFRGPPGWRPFERGPGRGGRRGGHRRRAPARPRTGGGAPTPGAPGSPGEVRRKGGSLEGGSTGAPGAVPGGRSALRCPTAGCCSVADAERAAQVTTPTDRGRPACEEVQRRGHLLPGCHSPDGCQNHLAVACANAWRPGSAGSTSRPAPSPRLPVPIACRTAHHGLAGFARGAVNRVILP